MLRRKPLEIILTIRQRETLEAIVRRQKSEQRLVKRAKIILYAAQGLTNTEIARRLETQRHVVIIWRKRWHEGQSELKMLEDKLSESTKQTKPDISSEQYTQMLMGLLKDKERSGKPPDFTAEQIIQLIALACKEPQQFGRPVSHWTPRELQEESIIQGIFKSISVRQVGRFLKRS